VYQHLRGSAHAPVRSLRAVFLSFDNLTPRQLHEEWGGDGYEALDRDTCIYNAKRAKCEDRWMDRRRAIGLPSMRARELETAALVYRVASEETTRTDYELEVYICTKEGGSSSKTATRTTRIGW
jgi:hypothetical protein